MMWSMLLASLLLLGTARAQDWPTYRADAARSGVATTQLRFPLEARWTHVARHAPRPAWDGPAKRDAYNKVYDLENRLAFDYAFHTVIVGRRLYYGSSADDQVHCLDTSNGRELWSYFTEGPIRFAPTIAKDRLYVGSDDGYAHCIDAKTGGLLWKALGGSDARRIPGNGRLISPWPVRSSVTVFDGTAYFTAGFLPSEGAWLLAVRARDGKRRYRESLGGQHPQGYLLASKNQLFMPTGRGRPAIFRRKDGRYERSVGGQGGSFALLVGESLVYGPGKTGQFAEFGSDRGEQLATFHGKHIVVRKGVAFLQSGSELACLDRTRFLALSAKRRSLSKSRKSLSSRIGKLEKEEAGTLTAKRERKKELKQLREQLVVQSRRLVEIQQELPRCFRWKVACELTHELILVGDYVIAGGEGEVAAFRVASGHEVWRAPVEGRAFGLAAAHETLFVSTDRGRIHAFARP